MSLSITIRKVNPSDQDTVYSFVCKLEETELDHSNFSNIFFDTINKDSNIYLIAEDDAKKIAIGFISCHGQQLLHHAGWVYEIQEMFIDDSYRNIGLGKKLIQELTKSLPAQTCSLEVTAQNKRIATHAFYQSAGFTSSHLKFTKSDL